MQPYFESYQCVKNWYEANIVTQQKSSDQLQLAHEVVLKSVVDMVLKEMIDESGPPPCAFSWFVMGSAGRREQAVFSDQDHGIFFDANGAGMAPYFITFGQKLSSALHRIGYPQCDGNVMSSNPQWCKSVERWEIQIETWMAENTWESLRYLLIFLDARVIVGDEKQLRSLKSRVYKKMHTQPALLLRLFENTKYLEKGIGLFHQFLTVSTGPYSGQLNIKNTAIFPYVNAIRLLAIVEEIEATSTLKRMEALYVHHQNMATHQENYKKLLHFRFAYGDTKCYEDVAYLQVERLKKSEKLELKRIYKDIETLQKYTEMIVQGAMEHE